MNTVKATSIDDIRYEDILDLRDLAELHSDLAARWMAQQNGDEDADPLDEEERELLIELDRFDREEFNGDLEQDAHNSSPTMVRYSYFTDYAQELAEDIGLVDSSNTLHGYIDWERFASDLKMDFQSVTFGGVEYFTGH